MKHAHPMITPLPGVASSEVRDDFSEDSAKLFDLLTQAVHEHLNTSDALLIEHVLLEVPDTYLRGTVSVSGNVGALNESSQKLRLEPIRQRRREDEPSVDAVLEWIAAGRLMSPARMSEVFDELEKAGWLHPIGGQLEITERAKQMVDLGRQSGWQRLNPNSYKSWRTSCDECSLANSDLDELVGRAEDLFGLELGSLAEQVRQLTSFSLE